MMGYYMARERRWVLRWQRKRRNDDGKIQRKKNHSSEIIFHVTAVSGTPVFFKKNLKNWGVGWGGVGCYSTYVQ